MNATFMLSSDKRSDQVNIRLRLYVTLGTRQRDAQVTDRIRPEAVAGHECYILAQQQFARELLGAEPAGADVEQYEHAALENRQPNC